VAVVVITPVAVPAADAHPAVVAVDTHPAVVAADTRPAVVAAIPAVIAKQLGDSKSLREAVT
jgi:hypothetical protein